MNDADDRIRELLAPLREAELPPESEQDLAAARARVLPTLQARVAALPARRAARQRLQLGSAAGALALAAAALLALRTTPAQVDAPEVASTATPRHVGLQLLALHDSATAGEAAGRVTDAQGVSHPLASLMRAGLPEDVRALSTGARAARLRTPRGAAMELAQHSRLELAADAFTAEAESLRLSKGEVHCQVPPLGSAGRFAIETPTARVVVHGTQFRVRVGDGDTCVSVTEGLVAVHHAGGEQRLGPGQQWGCQERAVGDDDDDDDAAGAGPKDGSGAKARKARSSRRQQPTADPHALEVENALLRDALRAERAGERDRACESFAALLERHPDTPLAEVARAGLNRCR